MRSLTAAALSVGLVLAAASPALAADDTGLLAWYPLTETSGTTAANGATGSPFGAATVLGGAGRGTTGVTLDGADDYVELPDNLLTGLTDVTISIDVLVDAAQATPYFVYGLGNATTADPNGYLFTTGNVYRTGITTGNYRTEQNTTKGANLTRGSWKTLTWTLSGSTGTLYEDGVQVAQNTGITVEPSAIGGGVTADNWIGRSQYPNDKRLKGQVKDFRLYGRALTPAAVADLAAPTSTAAVEADHAALTLGDTSGVLTDLTLPALGVNGSAITWSSSDPATVANNGRVTRPPVGAPPATATLTATLTRGLQIRTKAFTVTVLPQFDDATSVRRAVDAVVIRDLNAVRGNLTLPTTGEGAALTWTTSNAAVITPTGEVHRPKAGSQPVTVTLTVTARKGEATAGRDLVATVPALPAAQDDYGYLLAHFVEDANGYKEKVYLSLSKGEDPTKWKRLNGGEAVLTSDKGTTGVRDPYLLRSPEGDKFYIIATDLRLFGGDNAGWDVWTRQGSRSLLVWESTDLVHWSDSRLVKVAPDTAGMAWAPEVIYDDTTGEYVVFWASKLYAPTDPNHTGASYARILYAKTRDFHTFTPAEVLIDSGGELIDTSMMKHAGKIYRFSKDNGLGKGVYAEAGSGIFAKDFQILQTNIGQAAWGGVEGPLVFKDSYAEKWYLWVDRYGSVQGYRPLSSTDPAAGNWAPVTGAFELPSETKHGAVIALRGDEWDRLAGAQTAVSVQPRCIGSTAYLSVSGTNTTTDTIAIRLNTSYGSKTVTGVAPGQQAYQSYSSRASRIPAGTATVAGHQVSYSAITCN
ncbi:immunoglobulin-like domain-containing protein [Actinoplanes sp. NPDC000266]